MNKAEHTTIKRRNKRIENRIEEALQELATGNIDLAKMSLDSAMEWVKRQYNYLDIIVDEEIG
jgi:short-subunit dehydrogenase involved in D-alanine esterification of teichoic acids